MPTYNLASILEDSAAKFPERTAIVFGETRLSYPAVNAVANQVANLLVASGVKPGDKVALMCPNLPYFTIIYFGILKAGAVAVPLNVLLKGREVAYHLEDSDAKVLFAFEGTPDLAIGVEANAGFKATPSCEHFFVITADPAAPSPIEGVTTFGQGLAAQPMTFDTVQTDEDDTAVVLYTSGTTGRPKGAELRHRNVRDNTALGTALFGASSDDPDTFLCVLPLFHTFGQTVIQNGAIMFGGTIVLLPRFDAQQALALMLKEKVTFFGGVPTMYWGLLGALDGSIDVEAIRANLRVAVAGGAALPVEVHREVAKRFGVTILEGYGLSETSPVASFSVLGTEPKVGSIGVPVPGVEMALIEPGSWDQVEWTEDAIGEIAIKGHNVMKGYYKRPDATAEAISPDGWFRTGDLGKRDAEGWYYIVDRAKDMIIRGGFNVYPRELEEVLLTHPAISMAAVIGVPHESHGEEVKAYVILKPGASATADEIIAWGKNEMAAYKYPRIVEVVDSLPMTATGKILKRELS